MSSPTHTYRRPGRYDVLLNVADRNDEHTLVRKGYICVNAKEEEKKAQ